MEKEMYPLSGYRVVDFGWVAAGAAAGKILADMGAEVIKVETTTRLDTTRFSPDNVERSPETDPGFHAINRNKLGITVDMTKPEGAELLKKLVKVSDVVLENFAPGVMKRFGLDYKSLCLVKPDIVMVSMPGLGSWGPHWNTIAYAPGIAALSGLTGMIGYCGGKSVGIHVAYSDFSASTNAALAVLAALIHRKRTGEGQNIEVSQLEALISCLGEAVVYSQVAGKDPGTQGNRHPLMAPHNNYQCKGDDKWVSIAVKTNEEWENLVGAMDNPSSLRAEKFSTREGRLRHREELDEIITSWTLNYTAEEITDILQHADVAAFAVLDIGECYLNPHFQEREDFICVEHPVTGADFIVNMPWRMSETSGGIHRPAPMLGQHNQYILEDVLGLSKDEIKVLEQKEALK
ncbi:MAG: CoA transferase [Dehalococcoidales bacterium]|nr:CoA transferase [Dehalococcoidales bacterium]